MVEMNVKLNFFLYAISILLFTTSTISHTGQYYSFSINIDDKR